MQEVSLHKKRTKKRKKDKKRKKRKNKHPKQPLKDQDEKPALISRYKAKP